MSCVITVVNLLSAAKPGFIVNLQQTRVLLSILARRIDSQTSDTHLLEVRPIEYRLFNNEKFTVAEEIHPLLWHEVQIYLLGIEAQISVYFNATRATRTNGSNAYEHKHAMVLHRFNYTTHDFI